MDESHAEVDQAGTEGPQTYLQQCKARIARTPIRWPVTDENKKPKADIANVMRFLKWSGVDVVHDVFADRCLVSGLPFSRELDDEALRTLRVTMEVMGLSVKKETHAEWLFFIAQQRRMHPVQMYLDALVWDGQPRIGTWLTDYCGVADSEYARAVSELFLMGAVRRVRQPGVKLDTMVVLEGAQGQGKSSIPQVLASPIWFTDDFSLGLNSKEVIERLGGFWIVEIGELHGMSNKEIEHVKSFITRQKETARGAYRRAANTVLRQFVLIGTTNDRKYLRDATGNRRFLPIFIPGAAGSIDLEGLKAVRDQLWAEAAHREAAGASIVLPENLWAIAHVEQQDRVIRDPRAERLADLLELEHGFVATEELFKALDIDMGKREQRHQTLISSALHALGWENGPDAVKFKEADYRRRGWRKGPDWRTRILMFDQTADCFSAFRPEELPKSQF